MGVVLITHDLGVVAEMADRVVVMYAGEVVEEATVFELFENPGHPYTAGLLGSLPHLNEQRHRLDAIPGSVPHLLSLPTGCPFHPRCPYADEQCAVVKPRLEEKAEGHFVSCLKAGEVRL
ncbi:Oligopeptide transport ATP-binding protein OppD [compost metagenome]